MHQNSLPLMRANKAILKEVIADSVYGIKFIFTQKENIVATNFFEEKIKFTSFIILTHWQQISLKVSNVKFVYKKIKSISTYFL